MVGGETGHSMLGDYGRSIVWARNHTKFIPSIPRIRTPISRSSRAKKPKSRGLRISARRSMGFRGSRVQIPPSRLIASPVTTYGDFGRRLLFRGVFRSNTQRHGRSCRCLAITYHLGAQRYYTGSPIARCKWCKLWCMKWAVFDALERTKSSCIAGATRT